MIFENIGNFISLKTGKYNLFKSAVYFNYLIIRSFSESLIYHNNTCIDTGIYNLVVLYRHDLKLVKRGFF